MKKIVPSTPCRVALVLRRINGLSRSTHDDAKFGHIRDIVNVALATYDRPDDPVQSIDIHVTIGTTS